MGRHERLDGLHDNGGREMSNVTRWDWNYDYDFMGTSSEGEYVLYADYAALLAERDAMQAEAAMQLPEVRALVEAVTLLQSYVPTDVIECNGDKCREPWCASCCGWDDATNGVAVAMGHAAVARAALAPFTEASA
jgi:hypothetical protein